MASPWLGWWDASTDDDKAEVYMRPDLLFNSGTFFPCECDKCERMKKAAVQISDIEEWDDDDVSQHIIDTQEKIWETRKALHKAHMPELYLLPGIVRVTPEAVVEQILECSCDACEVIARRRIEVLEKYADNDILDDDSRARAAKMRETTLWLLDYIQSQLQRDGVHNVASDGSQSRDTGSISASSSPRTSLSATPRTHTYHRRTTGPDHHLNGGNSDKFAVCDHCHVHGLTCNEAEICDQCRLYEQPCVHRLCRQSPDRKAECPDDGCRYYHRDLEVEGSDRVESSEGTYAIIVSGRIPPYLSRGRLPNRRFEDLNNMDNWQVWHDQLNALQDQALAAVQQANANGVACDAWSWPCDCEADRSEYEDETSEDGSGSELEEAMSSIEDGVADRWFDAW